jgi:hypothetical protein
MNDIRLPVATGSGDEYVIKNVSASAKNVDVIDGIGTINDDLMRTLQPYESITAVDYVANKWKVV